MKSSSFFLLAASLAGNLALVAILLLRPAEPAGSVADPFGRTGSGSQAEGSRSSDMGGTPMPRGADVPPVGSIKPGTQKLWEQLRADDLAALVPKLREAGFPPAVIRRIITSLVSERFDAQRLEIEKASFEAPITTANTSSYQDPKMGPALVQLQRDQTELMKKLLGGTLSEFFADNEENKAMLRLQIGDIAPEKIEQLYAAAMDYSAKRMKIQAERGAAGPMLSADYERAAAVDKEYREEVAKFLTPTEASDFLMRNSEAAGRMRNLVGPARPTEAEYRAIFPIYQAYLDQFPSQNQQGDTPAQASARRAAEAQMLDQVRGVVGVDRAADFQQAGNPAHAQLNRLVARLDLPISAATQVAAVQTEMQQRAVALRDPSMDAPTRNAQLAAMQQEATTRVSKILGGDRGLEAYKQYGGQWLVSMAPRPPTPQPPKN